MTFLLSDCPVLLLFSSFFCHPPDSIYADEVRVYIATARVSAACLTPIDWRVEGKSICRSHVTVPRWTEIDYIRRLLFRRLNAYIGVDRLSYSTVYVLLDLLTMNYRIRIIIVFIYSKTLIIYTHLYCTRRAPQQHLCAGTDFSSAQEWEWCVRRPYIIQSRLHFPSTEQVRSIESKCIHS